MSGVNRAVSTEHIFIYAPEEQDHYERIYSFLRSADFHNAYDKAPEKQFNIGLEAVLWVLDQRLKEKQKPDLIYLETSLFPERTRINTKIVDFLCLKINDALDEAARKALLIKVFTSYKLIYTALHETQNTVYYVPEFLQCPSEMRMVFSEYVKHLNYPESEKEREVREKMKDVAGRSDIKAEIAAREQDQLKLSGWRPPEDENAALEDTFLTRDFLDREASLETGRKEKKSDLEENAELFHKLFHEEAFSNYPKTFLWCIPIVGAGEKQGEKQQLSGDGKAQQHLIGQGALFVMLAYKQPDVTLNDPKNLTTKNLATNVAADIAKTVSYMLKDYFISYLYSSTREMVDEVINRSLKVAAGSIMSRNISHNIGSHVSPRTRITAIEERLESFYRPNKQPEQGSGAKD